MENVIGIQPFWEKESPSSDTRLTEIPFYNCPTIVASSGTTELTLMVFVVISPAITGNLSFANVTRMVTSATSFAFTFSNCLFL